MTVPSRPAIGAARPAPSVVVPAGHRSTWTEQASDLWRELPGLIGDRVELLSLELQRAGGALAQIVAMVIAAAIVAVTAWITLWAGIGYALISIGLHWALAVVAVMALNLLAAGFAVMRMKKLVPLLALPASRRHLSFSTSSRPAASPAPSHDASPQPVHEPSSGGSALRSAEPRPAAPLH